MRYTEMQSPIGRLVLAADDTGLRHIRFVDGRPSELPEPEWTRDDTALAEPQRQIEAYFGGELRDFELKLAPAGTDFQCRVWWALADIPYAETVSYATVAKRIERPSASRAVGAANGQNPLPIVLPCHRVIGANGSLTGYGGGLHIKEALLALERRHGGQAPLFE
ncbi:MAG: methylated-DNA--[protein]-cysteine S-methyltransferase [Acidobacteriota bacterium]|nr:methylated-DNA--[protein]-cysteine S-methyltransferase [Acidobacteriota bacterium]